MSEIVCPYCDKEQQVDSCEFDHTEDALNEYQCISCEKILMVTSTIIIHYSASKADCLNGMEHKFEPMHIVPQYWPDAKKCSDCGKEVRGRFVDNP